MKEYEKPTMEVITLLGDVITDSCTAHTDCDTQGPGGPCNYECAEE